MRIPTSAAVHMPAAGFVLFVSFVLVQLDTLQIEQYSALYVSLVLPQQSIPHRDERSSPIWNTLGGASPKETSWSVPHVGYAVFVSPCPERQRNVPHAVL